MFIQPYVIAEQYLVCFCVHEEGNWIGWPGRGQSKLSVLFSASICPLFNHGMLQSPSSVLGWAVFQCTVRVHSPEFASSGTVASSNPLFILILQ